MRLWAVKLALATLKAVRDELLELAETEP